MATEEWMKVTRPDDGETVGYLEPLKADYSVLQPRTLLGHRLGGPTDFLDGEERLAAHGISELAERWQLRDAPGNLRGGVSILEVSADGIVVAQAELAKALVASERVTVPWPDLGETLTRHDGGSNEGAPPTWGAAPA